MMRKVYPRLTCQQQSRQGSVVDLPDSCPVQKVRETNMSISEAPLGSRVDLGRLRSRMNLQKWAMNRYPPSQENVATLHLKPQSCISGPYLVPNHEFGRSNLLFRRYQYASLYRVDFQGIIRGPTAEKRGIIYLQNGPGYIMPRLDKPSVKILRCQ
jgi:hypothetical protein